jgi:hypothetical protein
MAQVRSFESKHFIERLFCDCGTEMQYEFCAATEVVNPGKDAVLTYKHVCRGCGHIENTEGRFYPFGVNTEVQDSLYNDDGE